MVVALDRFGFHGEAAEVLRARPWRSPRGDAGRLRHWAAHAGALWAIAQHHRLTGDAAPARRARSRPCGKGPGSWPGITSCPSCPTSRGSGACGALVDAAWLLRLAGDGPSAEEAEAAAGQLRDAITASLEVAATRLGRLAMPAGAEPGSRRRHDRLAGGLRPARPAAGRRSLGRRHARRGAGALLPRARPSTTPSSTAASGRRRRCRSPAASSRPATSGPGGGCGGCSTPPPRRSPGRRRSIPGWAAAAGETGTTAGWRPPSSTSCAGCWSARQRRTAGSPWPRSSRRSGPASRSRSTTPRRITAGSPTPCAGTATGRRCCGSASAPV